MLKKKDNEQLKKHDDLIRTIESDPELANDDVKLDDIKDSDSSFEMNDNSHLFHDTIKNQEAHLNKVKTAIKRAKGPTSGTDIQSKIERHSKNSLSENSDIIKKSKISKPLTKEKEDKKNNSQSELSWVDLSIIKPVLKALEEIHYERPTKVQELTFPAIFSGRDVLANSITGSGKTGAFLIPLIQKIYKEKYVASVGQYIKVLLIVPSRELALQTYDFFQKYNKYTRLTASLVIGASDMLAQQVELAKNPDFVFATPGRILDHLQNTKNFNLEDLDVLVFDEADKLLELGFKAEILEIVKNCNEIRQTLLFSATLDSSLEEIIKLALKKPLRIQADDPIAVSKALRQEIVVLPEPTLEMREATLLYLVSKQFEGKVIIFIRTKHECHRIAILLGLAGIKAIELHGNLTQQQRLEGLEGFRSGEFRILLATDLASRGLDVEDVELVVNFELPQQITKYVHRIGRTARAGSSGVSLTICTEKDVLKMKRLVKPMGEKLFKRKLKWNLVSKGKSKIQEMEESFRMILREEKLEKEMRVAERETQQAENLLKYQDEIISKPKKEWFLSKQQKQKIIDEGSKLYGNATLKQDNLLAKRNKNSSLDTNGEEKIKEHSGKPQFKNKGKNNNFERRENNFNKSENMGKKKGLQQTGRRNNFNQSRNEGFDAESKFNKKRDGSNFSKDRTERSFEGNDRVMGSSKFNKREGSFSKERGGSSSREMEGGFGRGRDGGSSRGRGGGFSRGRDGGSSRGRGGGFSRGRDGGSSRGRGGGFSRGRDGSSSRGRDGGFSRGRDGGSSRGRGGGFSRGRDGGSSRGRGGGFSRGRDGGSSRGRGGGFSRGRDGGSSRGRGGGFSRGRSGGSSRGRGGGFSRGRGGFNKNKRVHK